MSAIAAAVFPPGLFTYAFMVHAWLATSAIAVVSALVGFFVILRGNTFAAHALPRAAFAGAAAAFLVGVSTLVGLAACALAMALALGSLDRGAGERGVLTALLLVAALGLGDLLLTLGNAYAPAVYALLFGQVVGVTAAEVVQIVVLAAIVIATLAVLYRPLLMLTTLPETAVARGVPRRLVRIGFLLLVALTAALTVPVVGALLAFSLMVAPAAAAARLARRPATALVVSVALALGVVWVSLIVAYDTNLPIGFIVTSLGTLAYLGARLGARQSTGEAAHGRRAGAPAAARAR